ncbi:MAG: hypothetical protein ACREAA_06800 [Candidatus Polarisedimenticolia bacterium]
MRSHSTRALTVTLALLVAVGPVGAGWEYSGSAGFDGGRADNPAFEGGCNPNYNPSSPLCALPTTDPRYNPAVCEPTISGDAINGDYTGHVGLAGLISGTWAGTAFDLLYAPGFYVYQTGDLNQLSHMLLSKWIHETSPRGTFVLSEDFSYTPEQVVDPNALAEGRVLLNRTTRTTNDTRVGYEHEAGPRTTLGAAYRYSIRSFGAEPYTDSQSNNVGLRFTGRVSSRTSLGVGYDFSGFAFEDGINPAAVNAGADAPSTAGLETPVGTYIQQGWVGWGYDSTETEELRRPRPGRPGRERRRGSVLRLAGGWGRLTAPDAQDGTYSAPYVDGSFAWHTLPVSATIGYLRGLTDGGGAFSNAETQNIYADMRMHIAREWIGILSGSYLVNEQVEFGEEGSLGDSKVRTISTRAGVDYDLGEHWVLTGSMTWFHQEICGDPCALSGHMGIPELSTFRIVAGFVWYSD